MKDVKCPSICWIGHFAAIFTLNPPHLTLLWLNGEKLRDCNPCLPLDAERNAKSAEAEPVDASDFAKHGILLMVGLLRDRGMLVALRLHFTATHRLIQVPLHHDDPTHWLIVPPTAGLFGVVGGDVGDWLDPHQRGLVT